MNPLIQLRKTTSLIAIALLVVCFAMRSAPNSFGVVPSPDGGYPASTRQKERKLFKILLPEQATRDLAGIRFLATQSAASIPVLALERWY